jgi:hypothetical protein
MRPDLDLFPSLFEGEGGSPRLTVEGASSIPFRRRDPSSVGPADTFSRKGRRTLFLAS